MVAITRRSLTGGIIIAFLVLVAIVSIVPLMHEASISLSSENAVLRRDVGLFPTEFSLRSYQKVFADKSIARSLVTTSFITIVYTVISMILTICCAYPLTRPQLRGRKQIMTYIIFTMYFSAGMLPNYMLIKELSLLNTMWALILPIAISPFYMIILRTSFLAVPESLSESAYIDGADYFTILLRIILPLSKPILATLSLFYAVHRWNVFQDALFYITRPELYTLQLKLSFIVMNNRASELLQMEGAIEEEMIVPAAITAATVMVATVPILLVYPWLQRYFISGVMIGSVKG